MKMKILSGAAWLLLSCSIVAAWAADAPAAGQSARTRATEHRVGPFRIVLRADTQTLERLSPSVEPDFSFVPTSRAAARAGDGFNHIGDLDLRVRAPGGAWRDFASAWSRKVIRTLPVTGKVIAAADITASMGAAPPFAVERRWVDEDGLLALRFRITNTSGAPLEIGALAMPMVFDNILTDRNLDQAHTQASFVDPYIGRDAGYLQVTRLNGRGPALLVLPAKDSPLEAYVPLKMPQEEAAGAVFTEKTPRSQSFEGFYAWTVHSAGFADREWKDAGEQWNAPTARTLRAGESIEVGVRLAETAGVAAIDATLAAHGRPVTIGVPGYVVPTDQRAQLFVKAPSPIAGIDVHPAGAMTVTPDGARGGWTRLAVRGRGWGRVRLTLHYANGERQTVNYFVTKPLAQAMADLGRFSTTKQWFEGKDDPFGRSPAILSYDREAEKIVTVDHRVWIAGMSDEGGAGPWVAAVAKQLDNPDAGEIAKIERLIDETVVGRLQIADGKHAGAVRKSLFYYDPVKFPGLYPDQDHQKWRWAWDKKEADRLDRSYNYPHLAAAYWVMYRLARNHDGLVTRHDWHWYLAQANLTIVAMMRDAGLYAEFGLMEGDVFVDILKDLKREGMTAEADTLTRLMQARATHWRSLKYPFGSEMPWDSTGQPEVYAWMRYFGYQTQADQTRDVILAYTPTVPNWGYNGNARRYWDFGTAGKWERTERQIHHYGSALNAVPLFDAFRRNPADLHLLRVAYGGTMGGIANIDRDGFSSTAFHAWPDIMKPDPYSGDFGMGFFGHAYAAATYVVNDPTLGWLGFGGDVTEAKGVVRIVPRDTSRSRLFVAPAGQWITLEAGKIASATWDPALRRITLTLDPVDRFTPAARVLVEATVAGATPMMVVDGRLERGAYTVPLATGPRTITLAVH
ncbi:DUF5695 domain-containing protein [Xanthomonas theicola]|uniref:Uncharacterized protein n=1 Tax=Xanthomonas theicola TaxID=56464 RepID=A0A2S6ZAH3_9XANT|nr:DUF5695 domain-containing protein [Xanthomonas theicola]PPT79412.1 hypothetical protein XthCFBP4691_18860 [Xanthomonas theicola]QNH26760.1 hypothetical protein G4Q83_21400 [Xanthomonas theicola]